MCTITFNETAAFDLATLGTEFIREGAYSELHIGDAGHSKVFSLSTGFAVKVVDNSLRVGQVVWSDDCVKDKRPLDLGRSRTDFKITRQAGGIGIADIRVGKVIQYEYALNPGVVLQFRLELGVGTYFMALYTQIQNAPTVTQIL